MRKARVFPAVALAAAAWSVTNPATAKAQSQYRLELGYQLCCHEFFPPRYAVAEVGGNNAINFVAAVLWVTDQGHTTFQHFEDAFLAYPENLSFTVSFGKVSGDDLAGYVALEPVNFPYMIRDGANSLNLAFDTKAYYWADHGSSAVFAPQGGGLSGTAYVTLGPGETITAPFDLAFSPSSGLAATIPVVVPEPATGLLVSLGMALLGGMRRPRRER